MLAVKLRGVTVKVAETLDTRMLWSGVMVILLVAVRVRTLATVSEKLPMVTRAWRVLCRKRRLR